MMVVVNETCLTHDLLSTENAADFKISGTKSWSNSPECSPRKQFHSDESSKAVEKAWVFYIDENNNCSPAQPVKFENDGKQYLKYPAWILTPLNKDYEVISFLQN